MRWLVGVLLLVAASPAQAELLLADRGDGHVVARYGSFNLVEASGATADRLRAAGATPRNDMRRVRLQSRSVDAAAEAQRAPARDGLQIVQFVGPVKDAWLQRLRRDGVRVISYMAQNAYLVRATALHDLGDEVRAVFALRAADKIAPEVAEDGIVAVQVQMLAGAARPRLRATRPALRVGPYVTEFITARRSTIDALAADDSVISIERDAPLVPEDESQTQALAANLNPAGTGPSGPGYLAWLRARMPTAPNPFDFVVDLSDSGLDDGQTGGPTVHPDLAGRVAYSDSFQDGSDASGRDCTGHGSLNAGIVAGFNDTQGSSTHEDTNGLQYGLGVAPWVRVGSSKILDSCENSTPLGSFGDIAANAYAKGARIVNNSWGFNDPDVLGAYTPVSQAYDAFVRDAQPAVPGNQELVEIKSAGNNGNGGPQTVSAPGTGKNLITVGATENVRAFGGPDRSLIGDAGADNITERIGFSGRGPTDDGRLKPDLMAPGTHVASTRSQASGFNNNGISGTNSSGDPFNSFYTASSGTSHSAPAVAGAAALIRQFFSSLGSGAFTPSPAMTKALLVNAARDLGIDYYAQGFGLVNLDATLTTAGRSFSDQTQRLDNSGEVATRALTVPDAGAPVTATLAWTDPPGPTVGDAWVNDLDLEVQAGDQLFHGNGAPDPRNNVEKVVIPPGVSGPITVRVRAVNIAGDGVPGIGDATDQDFALVSANAVGPPPPPPPPPPPAADAVAPPPVVPPPPARPAPPPRLSTLSVRPSRFTRARGTTIRFTLDRPGRVVVRFEQRVRGRYRARGQIERDGRAGANSLRFKGRVGRRTLPAGSYRLVVYGTSGGVTGPRVRRSFRITAPF